MRQLLLALILWVVGPLNGYAQIPDSLAYVPVLQFGEALLENGDYDLAARVFYDVWHSDAPDSLRALAAYRIKISADSLAAHLNRQLEAFGRARYDELTPDTWSSRWTAIVHRGLRRDGGALDSLGIRIWFDHYADYAHVDAKELYESVWSNLGNTYWGQRMRVESGLDMDTYMCDRPPVLEAIRDFIDAYPNSPFIWDAHYVLGATAAGILYGEIDYPDLEVLRQEAIKHLEIAESHKARMLIYRESEFLGRALEVLRNPEKRLSVSICD